MIDVICHNHNSFGICHFANDPNDKCKMIYDYDKGLHKSFELSNDQVISEH